MANPAGTINRGVISYVVHLWAHARADTMKRIPATESTHARFGGPLSD